MTCLPRGKPYFTELRQFVDAERQTHTVFRPTRADVLNALRFTPYENVKVFILGQDPYHDNNQAHGLAFSVRPGVRPLASLANIFKERRDDRGIPVPASGYLAPWATQGVLRC